MPKPKSADHGITVVIGPEMVMNRTGLDRDAIVARVETGTFPKPRLHDGRVVWNEVDVREWIAEQVSQGLMRKPPPSPAMLKLIDVLAEECVRDFLTEQRRSESQ